uniref:Uncharacterized protein n=1 Tax=viral metagenome TaxID=1070528 RepID=A0A6M3K5B3_9ZZZZ
MKFKEYEAYKYIRLESDEFRFTILRVFGGVLHKELVKEGEVAISAGTISIYPDYFSLLNEGSGSLHIFGSKDSDFPLLEKIIWKPFRNK